MLIHIMHDATASCELQKLLPSDAEIEQAAKLALEPQHQDDELSIRTVDRVTMQHLNHDFRQQDKPTNVLSFPYPTEELPDKDSATHYLGDIALCQDIIINEAQKRAILIKAHWLHLVIHGVLHLQGYDHQLPSAAKIMEHKECQLMQQLGYAAPY